MKRIAAIFAGLAIAVAALAGTGKVNHVLTSLWKEYKAASDADLPLKQIEILAKIKQEASEKQLAWDFWDAADKYVIVQRNRNWKLADSLERAFEKEAMAFPVAVVGYEFMLRNKSTEKTWDYTVKNKDKLTKGRNQAFYYGNDRTSIGLSGMLPEYIKTDYEYALWTLALGGYGSHRDNATKELKEVLAGAYPTAPYLEYTDAGRSSKGTSVWREKMQGIIDKYPGKAIALYPQSALLGDKFRKLRDNNETQEAFKALRAEAAGFEAARKAYSGSEAAIVSRLNVFQVIIDELDGKILSLKVTPEKATVYFRNTKTAWLTMVDSEDLGKVLFRQELKNTANSYFVNDSVEVKLPNLGDGAFEVTVGSKELKKERECHARFSRFSYALSGRNSAIGYGIFAANAATGKPLEEVEVVVEEKNKKHVKKVKLASGYTPLPDFGVKDLEECFVYVRWKDAAGHMRRSPNLYPLFSLDLYQNSEKVQGRLFLNTGAFHPGETVKFKGLIYKSLADGSNALEPAGKKATVIISDPSGKEYSKTEHELSEMGTFASEYTLPEDAKTGMWDVSLRCDGQYLFSRGFYYGDFVPPTFECTFEPIEEAVFPGQEVHVKGRLESFTGHKLSEAEVSYEVNVWGDEILSGQLKPNADGSFDISFVTRAGYHTITLEVTDATGESQEFEYSIPVSARSWVKGRLINESDSYQAANKVLVESKAKFEVEVISSSRKVTGAKYNYELFGPDKSLVFKGEGVSGEEFELDLSGKPDGCYELALTGAASNPGGSYPKDNIKFIKYTPGASIPADVPELFWRGEEAVGRGEEIAFRIGSGTHPVWAAVELYGPAKEVLWTKTVFVAKGSFDKVALPYQKWYYDDVCFGIVFFNDYEASTYEAHYYRVKKDNTLPLKITSFRDEARPGQELTIELETHPGAEAVASVWDKATEAINRNVWWTVYIRQDLATVPLKDNAVRRPSGNDGVVAYGFRYLKRADVVEEAVAEEAIPFALAGSVSGVNDMKVDANSAAVAPPAAAREDFSGALAFEPFLRAGADGKVSFTFRTSDKLSTFKMAVFAHDDKMRNSLVEKEFKVTLPVKVDVLKPEYLVAGDEFKLTATVSSAIDKDLAGKLTVYRYDGTDYKNLKPVSVTIKDVIVPSGGVVAELYDITTQTQADHHSGQNNYGQWPSGGQLGLLVSFQAEDGTSDAMFFTVPVLERAQVLTESHSAVLLSGADKDALVKDLQGRFTGTTHYGAEYKEINVLDMVREALQQKLKESGNDVLSLTEALYVRTVLAGIPGQDGVIAGDERQALLEKILALQNEDGGFSWFKGFKSSPVLTAVVLERFKKMAGHDDGSAGHGPSLPAESGNRAVKYLDTNHFSADTPYWRGGLSDAQYMYVRALYSDVAFTEPTEKDAAKKFKEFKKDAVEYLTPAKARGMNGQIMAKARRLNTLRLLLASDSGIALAKQWGIKKSAKLEKSMKADVASLLEYAVKHRDGGIYYPNAVMPWRGLLETEAYAHTQLAALLPEVADGIRLWLMLQKETQHWDLTPHFVDAIACILDGSKEVLDTKVLTLTKTYRKPLEEIVAAGNGFTISREFVREATKGDKITAVYRIHNAENRSFVRVRVPREATLRPVDQLSGFSWRYYKEVHTEYTDYYFDSMPEEGITIQEDFFVTQTGTFACGVPEVESLYAPHYRANSAFPGTFVVRK